MTITFDTMTPIALHPAVVHFPIALLLVSTLFDAACLIFRRFVWIDRAGSALLILGSAGLGAAFLTGNRAAEKAAPVTGAAQGILAEHEDLALITLGVAGGALLLKLFVTWLGRHDLEVNIGIFRLLALILSFGAAFLLVLTAYHGGQLVYDHGIGVNLAG
ncbi:MAG: DUF2231 domain-containing protein [Thermoanaerobaculales bacterium]|jgi:uncharacterized membrane protein|nr:DUF2231 domain-containing protein [Thermoanaerobaculales bacterium]